MKKNLFLITLITFITTIFLTQHTVPFGKVQAQNHTTPWGKDADLALDYYSRPNSLALQNNIQNRNSFKEIEKFIPLFESFSQNLSKKLIHFHQDVISPADGPRSHHKPSSSQYALEAIQKYGFFLGVSMGCDRLMRENDDPWVYPTVTDSSGDCFKWDPVR